MNEAYAQYVVLVMGQYFKAIGDMYRYDNFHKGNQIENMKKLTEALSNARNTETNITRIEKLAKDLKDNESNLRTHDRVMLISCLAHFDSFLNNVTKLVLYKNPNKALGRYAIPVSTLLSKSRLDTINAFINKKTAEVSRKDLFSRLEFIRGITTEKLSISKPEKIVLRRLSDQRNKVVHEQQYALFALKEDLSIEAKFDESDSVDNINSNEFDVPEGIAARIYTDVMRHIQGREMEGDEKNIVTSIQSTLRNKVVIGSKENTWVEVLEGGG